MFSREGKSTCIGAKKGAMYKMGMQKPNEHLLWYHERAMSMKHGDSGGHDATIDNTLLSNNYSLPVDMCMLLESPVVSRWRSHAEPSPRYWFLSRHPLGNFPRTASRDHSQGDLLIQM